MEGKDYSKAKTKAEIECAMLNAVASIMGATREDVKKITDAIIHSRKEIYA